jgi:hypothetical protein
MSRSTASCGHQAVSDSYRCYIPANTTLLVVRNQSRLFAYELMGPTKKKDFTAVRLDSTLVSWLSWMKTDWTAYSSSTS